MIKMLMFDIKESEQMFLNTYDTSDYEITYFKESLNKDTKLSVKECDETAIISVFITSKITKEVLEKFKNLRIIVTRSICYSHIDLEECRKRNIAVINATDYARDSVSQFVISMIFNLTRNIIKATNNVKEGVSQFEKYEGINIENLTLGVIGTGSIGGAVCELAHKLGMKIYATDFIINNDISDFVQYVPFNDVLRLSDIVTLHIPYTKDYYHLFSDKQFEIMKETSYIINVSKEEFIDHTALYKAIKTKKIKGGAIDIIIEEKDIFNLSADDMKEILVRQKLTELPEIIVTPRIAYDTKESLENILISNFHDIKNNFSGQKSNRVV